MRMVSLTLGSRFELDRCLSKEGQTDSVLLGVGEEAMWTGAGRAGGGGGWGVAWIEGE